MAKRYKGDLIAQPGVVYDYTEITGNVDARAAPAGAFPVLTTVGGFVSARAAPAGAFPVLTTVGGTVFAAHVAAGEFPALTTVGGTVYAPGAAAPALRHHGDAAALRAALAAQGLTLDDGILCHVVSRRGNVSRVRGVGRSAISYLVTDGTHHAHGATLAEARADLRLKQGDRDTTPYQGWTRETVVSQADGIAAYRAITGACRQGVSDWLAGRKLPAKLTVGRICDETRGAYGHEAFTAFVDARARAMGEGA